MAIEGSHLYEVLSARWAGDIRWPLLLNQLNRAHESPGVVMDLDANDIDSAVVWRTTPQGQAYWDTISEIDNLLRWPRPQAKPKEPVKETVYAAEYH